MTASRSLLLAAALAFSMSACSGTSGPTAIELQIDSLAFTATCPPIDVGDSCQMSAVAFGPEGQQIGNPVLRWLSWNAEIAEVNDNGVVTGRGPGSTTIEVSNTTGSVFVRTDVLVVTPSKQGRFVRRSSRL